MEAVPKTVATGIKSGKVDLNDPAKTLALLKANAVVGVTGFFEKEARASSQWAFNARFVILRLTIPSCRELGGASMVGRTEISI